MADPRFALKPDFEDEPASGNVSPGGRQLVVWDAVVRHRSDTPPGWRVWPIPAVDGLLALATVLTMACASHPSSQPTQSPAGSPSAVTQTVTAMHAVSASTVWLDTSTVILKSNDAGAHWTQMLSGRGTLGPETLLDRDHAWVAATNRDQSVAVWRTADGGRSWQVGQAVPAGGGLPLQLAFADSEHGWLLLGTGAAAGSEGVRLLASSNGGETWVEVSRAGQGSGAGTIPFPCRKVGVTFVTSADGFLAGDCAGGPAFMYRTQDGGRTWQLQPLTSPAGWPGPNLIGNLLLEPPRFFDATHGILTVRGSSTGGSPSGLLIYLTADGGNSWVPVSSPPGTPVAFAPVSMTTWLAADEAVLNQTVDGGHSWSAVRPIPSLHRTVELQFTSPTAGWALQQTDRGTSLLRTQDGGHTWAQVVTG